MTIKRNDFIPFLDSNALYQKEGATGYDWLRIDKSTVNTINYNPQTETQGFIDAESDSTLITGYQKSTEQEIRIDETNACYRAIDHYFHSNPTGSSAVIPFMYARPYFDEDGVIDKTKFRAEVYKEATVAPGTEDNKDGMKDTFTINMNGDPEIGTCTKASDGTWTFTPDGGEEVQTFRMSNSKKDEDE